MKNLNPSVALILFFVFLLPLSSWSQKRIKKPSKSGIENADKFVDKSFEIYNNVYVYDSLTVAGVEVPGELEDEILENAQRNIDSLWEIFPDVVDDVANGDYSMIKKSRATLNMNKVKKAIKYCVVYIKESIVGTKEDE